jgi:hypothetical protein
MSTALTHSPMKALAAAALAAVAMTAALAPAQADAAPRKCYGPNTYEVGATNSYARTFEKNGNVFVCVKATGRTTQLQGAAASEHTFAIAGQYVAWSSGSEGARLRVLYIPTRRTTFNWTSDRVEKIALKSNGAVAWAATPDDFPTYVQGTERRNHSPNMLSDDERSVDSSSLRISGGRAAWRYTDGTSGSGRLF